MKSDSARDKAMDKLIAARLRAGLNAGGADCPEVEILAAFVERALTPRERASFENHLAGCARCQQSVAELVRLSEADGTAGSRAAAPSRASRRFAFRWAWAGTAMAAVLVAGLWLTDEYQTGLRQREDEKARVVNQLQERLAAAQVPAAKEKSSGQETQAAAHLGPVPPSGIASGPGQARALQQLSRQESKAKAARAPKPSAVPEIAKQTAQPQVPVRARAAAEAYANLAAKKAGLAGVVAESAVAKSENAPSPSPPAPSAPTALLAVKPLRETTRTETVAEESSLRDQSAAKTQKRAKAAFNSVGMATQMVEVQAQPSVMQTTPPAWRVGPRGLILEANSHGNWKKHKSGVKRDLFGISFSSPSVGWVVGERGTILRTTDGGNTWLKMPSPTDEDLIQVSATNALTAAVTTRSGVRYTTTDGGRTWIQNTGIRN